MMKSLIAILWAGVLSAGLGLAGGARAAAPPPLEAYGKLPSIEDIEISPDGTRIASIWVPVGWSVATSSESA